MAHTHNINGSIFTNTTIGFVLRGSNGEHVCDGALPTARINPRFLRADYDSRLPDGSIDYREGAVLTANSLYPDRMFDVYPAPPHSDGVGWIAEEL